MSIVPGQPDPDRNKAIQLYSALGACLVLMVIPLAAAALASVVMVVVVLMLAGHTRRHAAANSLSENHAIYVARTVWIGSIFAVVTLALGVMYLLQTVDNTVLEPCMKTIMDQVDTLGPDVSMLALEPYLKPCMDSFVKENMTALIISASITMVPVMVYFAFRFIRGLSRVLGGYRIAKPKAWI